MIKANPNDTRIAKVRLYLFDILDELLNSKEYEVNANFLKNDAVNYSLDRLPIDDDSSSWIIPIKQYREVYELRSRNVYGSDVMDNLSNIGFFEAFEDKIYSNNKEGILPEINGIESIECLNVGALSIAQTDTAMFAIQIEIKYLKEK